MGQSDDGLAHAAMTSRTAPYARPGPQDVFRGRVRALRRVTQPWMQPSAWLTWRTRSRLSPAKISNGDCVLIQGAHGAKNAGHHPSAAASLPMAVGCSNASSHQQDRSRLQ